MEKHLIINGLWSRIYLPINSVNEIVIGVHGFAGDKESSVLIALAEKLNEQEKALLVFDLPSHGENDNSKVLNLTECIESIGKILEYVKKEYQNIPISFFSTSFGAFLTLSYLAERREKLHKVILRAPAIFMGEVLENVILPEHNINVQELKKVANLGYEVSLLVDDKFLSDLKNNSLDKKTEILDRLYVLQGKLDTTVDPVKNQKFFDKHYPNNYEIFYFENADHRFKKPGELEQIIEITLNVLNEN